MPVIHWNDSYSVKSPSMDAQHQQLFGAINSLYDAINRDAPDRDNNLTCVRILTDYTVTHFAAEEALMREMDYPDLGQHIDEHKKLIAQLKEFERRLNSADNDHFLDDDMVEFLVGDWLLNHVLEKDQKYSPHL